MDPITQQIALASAGAGVAPAAALDVEDLFNTFLYEGNASSRTITNGIDLAGEGGMVWIKGRTVASSHIVQDTERGTSVYLSTDLANLDTSNPSLVTGFNSDGFDLGGASLGNGNNDDFASWTFRKAPGFFDVVTYTGDGNSSQTISHNLGSAPGMIWVKRRSGSGGLRDWVVYHRTRGATQFGTLNDTSSFSAVTTRWNDTEPTASEFTVGSHTSVNDNSSTYVAYLFAHDDAQFGPAGDESIIKCGSYTGNGSNAGPTVSLGWEPQWVLIKKANGSGSWVFFDTARGIAYDDRDALFDVESIGTDVATKEILDLNPDGFQITNSLNEVNNSGGAYIYMAIRRPDRAPAVGTDFFQVRTRVGTGSNIDSAIDFNADAFLTKRLPSAASWYMSTRGFPDFGSVKTDQSLALGTDTTTVSVRGDVDSTVEVRTNTTVNATGDDYADYIFKRARGAFDTVFYTGTGSAQAFDHGLGVVPKMMWVKCLSNSGAWIVYHEDVGNTDALRLDDNSAAITLSAYWNDTSPTSTQFTVGTNSNVGGSGREYVAYLFGNVPGVIDIGSYTGTGVAGLQIDCGFTAGARFVLIKCTTTGTTDWNVYDTARGITIGSSPELSLNTSGSESSGTNLEPYSAGFEVNSTASDLNTSGETYLYMAIA